MNYEIVYTLPVERNRDGVEVQLVQMAALTEKMRHGLELPKGATVVHVELQQSS